MRWDRIRKQVASESGHESSTYFGFRKVSEKEKAGLVLQHFNFVARKYDFMNTLLSFGLQYLWKRSAVAMLGLKRGDWVLDLCGGTGDLSVLAARVVGVSGRAILYDINRTMIDHGRRKLDMKTEARSIHIVQGDAEKISFRDGRFDAAMVGFGIRNLTCIERGFEEMHRVLKPQGRVLCLEFSQPKSPVFRWIYDLYSFYVMPALGRVLTGSRQAYTYLPESIKLFPMPGELKLILERIGFRHVRYRRITNGIAVAHLGVKT